MMKYILAIIVAIHGLLHFMGFAKAFGYLHVHQITKDISKQAGILWLLTTGIFIVTGILIALGRNWWPMGTIAVVLSQLLIGIYWKDAKWGSVANAMIIICLVVNYAGWHFYDVANKQASKMLDLNSGNKTIVTNKILDDLPQNVQKWLKHSGVAGKEQVQTVRLMQKGILRTATNSKWMPVEAIQYFTVDKPSFIWIAKIRSGSLMHISGKDSYKDGKGTMIIKMSSLITVADASGREIDQGTLVRYLAEIQWFPSAAISPYIKWKEINANSAEATMSFGGVTASGVFTFSNNGDITCFEAQRYMEHNGHYSLETWSVPVTGYREFFGVRVPSKGTAVWKLKTGDFEWFNWEITDIAYNTTSAYRIPW